MFETYIFRNCGAGLRSSCKSQLQLRYVFYYSAELQHRSRDPLAHATVYASDYLQFIRSLERGDCHIRTYPHSSKTLSEPTSAFARRFGSLTNADPCIFVPYNYDEGSGNCSGFFSSSGIPARRRRNASAWEVLNRQVFISSGGS